MPVKKRGLEKYIFKLLILVLIIISLIIIGPFLPAILTGLILSYIFYPLFKILNKWIKNKDLCSLVLCTFVLVIVLLPSVFVANALIRESFDLYNHVKANNLEIELPTFLQEDALEDYVSQMASRGTLFIFESVSDFIFSLPRRILDGFIIIFLMFYLFKDGPNIIKKVKQLLPFEKKIAEVMSKEFADITFAVIYGLVVTAMVQGLIGGLGFYIFKIDNPILWGTVMAFIAIIPFLGPFLVWLPIGLFETFYGNKTSGIGVLLYGIFVISTIDNIIRPKIIGSRAKLHPAVVLIGVVGGIKLLGFIGVVIGPLMLALLISFLDKYRVSRHGTKS